MKTHDDILRELRIVRRGGQGASFTTTCPECSAYRKKKRDPCLSVKLTADAVLFNCHHCTYEGGKFVSENSGTDWRKGVRSQGHKPGNSRPVRHLYR